MIPRPQLNLNSISLSGEKTTPPALEIPGFPLDAPSKNIMAEEELVHNCLKALALPRNRQGERLTGLTELKFLFRDEMGPNQVI